MPCHPDRVRRNYEPDTEWHIRRIVSTVPTPEQLALAAEGLIRMETMSLEEFKRRYPRTNDAR